MGFIARLDDGKERSEGFVERDRPGRIDPSEQMRRHQVALRVATDDLMRAVPLGASDLLHEAFELSCIDNRADKRLRVIGVADLERAYKIGYGVDEAVMHGRIDNHAIGAHANLALMKE